MKIKAYSFIEIMAAMIVLGILFVITTLNVVKVMADSKMARFKKGYASIESAIGYLTSNKLIYGSRNGFKDTTKVELKMKKNNTDEIISTGEVIGKNPNTKFRDAFKYYLNVTEDNIDCRLYLGYSSDKCFMTDDGVVFGIPNTDFDEMATIKIKDSDGDKITVVPITMYVDFDEKQKDPKKDAFIVGVRYDGALHFIRTFDNCKSDPKVIQCNLDKYIESATISKSDED